jgi:hypothetical protein
MHAYRSWAVLLGAVGVACATAIPLDSDGNPITDFDGSFGGPDTGSNSTGGATSTGGYTTTTGGYKSSGGTTQSTGGAATSGGRVSTGGGGGGQTATGGKNQGGSGGTLPNTGGRAPTGGAQPTGGAMPTGGTTPTGGAPPTGGRMSTDAGSCPNGQKMCGGVCVVPAPSNGCGLTGCNKCPGPPPNGGVLACDNNAHTCDFVCLSGFTKQGNTCMSNGGSGGTGGGGGSTGNCVASVCPKCCFGAEPGCCASSTSCGCPLLCIPGTCG